MISIGGDDGLENAIVALDVEPGRRPRFISKRTIAIGHQVPLRRPIRKKNGAVQTHERTIGDADLIEFWGEARAVLQELAAHPAAMSGVIVSVERVIKAVERDRFGGSMATGLTNGNWMGGEIAGIARWIFGAGAVVTRSEAEWRNTVIGAHDVGRGLTEDQQLGILIPRLIDGWPPKSNPHERDAAGLALDGAARAAAIIRSGMNATVRNPIGVVHESALYSDNCK